MLKTFLEATIFQTDIPNKEPEIVGKEAVSHATVKSLFAKPDPNLDGEDCLHDCESCTIKYPAKFEVDMEGELYGNIDQWETHLLVATGKTDWVRDVADEAGSIMEAVGKGEVKPGNGKMMLSASNMPVHHSTGRGRVLLLPAFVFIDNVTPANVSSLVNEYVTPSVTNSMPLSTSINCGFSVSDALSLNGTLADELIAHQCPHRYLILLCSQRTRDARCGQSAPLLRREFERHLRPLGLLRDLNDERPGGVGIYFISHVGGHRYSANVMIYRRADALGANKSDGTTNSDTEKQEINMQAAQCIWLARVRPADCENIVKYTLLQSKVVKPEMQLRGGFDRAKGLASW